MAGMLPGVEAARRRRIYQGSGGIGSNQPSIGLLSSPSSHSRRSSSSSTCFSLFSSSSNSASSLQRRKTNEIDEKLGQLAREAKERLDERLRAQTKSAIKRNNSDVSSERMDGRRGEREMRTEVYGTKKKKLIGLGLGLGLGWGKQQMGWKTWEQEECAVCLEEFKVGENVVNLPCAHTFHSRCLVPWLHTSPHCPCCRISIFS